MPTRKYFNDRISRFVFVATLALFATDAAHPRNLGFSNLREGWELGELEFEPVDLLGNRSAGRIQAITQSRSGLLWIGSRQGLFRYDGQRVRPFAREPRVPSSLPSDSIRTLHIDQAERLWVGTDQGVALYQRDKESFVRYLQPQQTGDVGIDTRVNAIAHSSDGTVYAVNEAGRVFAFDEELADFVEKSAHRFGAVKSLVIDPQDRLWIGSSGSLYRFDPQTQALATFEGPIAAEDRVTLNYVNSIYYRGETEVWLATSVKGLLVLNPLDGSVEQIPFGSQPEAYVNEVGADSSGRIWSANNAGITLLDRASRAPILTPGKDAAALNTPPSGINTLFVDHQGTLWIGSNYDGVSKATSYKKFETVKLHERNPDVLPSAPASAFLEDRKGNLWVGHPKSGLAMYPPGSDSVLQVAHDPDDPNSLTDQPILCLFEDSRGQIWIGTYRGGLFRYRPDSGNLAGFRHDPDDPRSIGGHDIRAIAEASDGTLWLATHGSGVVAFDPESETFANYTVANRAETGFYVPNDWINTLLVDSQQYLWLGARNGVARISPDRRDYVHFVADVQTEGALSHSQTSDLFEDSQGRIWIATKDGLDLFDPEALRFKSYSVPEGLPDRSISSIIEDDQGYLWLGTLGGLARFDPATETCRSYDTTDGLVSDDFFETSVAKGAGGLLYFGQNKGLTRFDPRDIVDDEQTPNVFVTGLRVFGRPLRVSEDGPLTKSLLRTSRIDLPYDQNALIFEFVAIDFKNPAKNLYQYKLEGFDKDWSPSTSRAEAIYTNLPPGHFVFRVQAANIDGYWNTQGDSLAIQITPPIWGTLGFRIAITLLIASVPVALFFWRLNSIRSEARRLEVAVAERTKELKQANIWLEEANAKTQSHGELLERTVRERTKELEVAKEKAEHSDKLKSAFLANMSHEIRTPMNAIIGFLQMLESSDLKEDERQHFQEIISQSSKSLLTLIDDILDLSAIEAGEAEISPQACNIDEICEELGALFRESLLGLKKGKVRFTFERNLPESLAPSEPLTAVTDPLRLKQILWNLLSNALKFTEEGEIRLGVTVRRANRNAPAQIEFSVKDTGIGIPKEEHQRIFERFHKLDEDGKKLYRGTGLGLTITHTLVTLMDGMITLESEPNVGTEFFVTFPFKNHPAGDAPDGSKPPSQASILEVDYAAFSVLVVEDETPNFEYISRVLKKTGIKIEWVDRGDQALERFQSQAFDLVLLDLKLPQVDGYEVAAQIRAVSPDIPIIVQSAFAMREDRIRSQKAGANEHLSKPFSPQDLISTLSKYLLASAAQPPRP